MKNFKKIVALIVAILVLVPFGSMFSTSAAAVNLAVNATASTGMNLLANNPVKNIIDTNPSDNNNNWAAVSYVDGLAWYQLDFATAQTVNKVLIFNNQETAFTPADIAIDVKTSNGKWTRVAEKHDLESASSNSDKNSKYTSRNFYFAPVSDVKAVRVTANKNGNSKSNNFMVVSFCVYNDSEVTSADYTGVTAGTGNRVIPALANEKVNLALDATVTANNILPQYPTTNANDGKGIAATAQNVSDAITQYANKIGYFQLDLKEASTVNNVILYSSVHELTYRPTDYAIDVKTTDGNWTRVAKIHNKAASGDWGDSIRNFKFAAVDNVVSVRVTGNGTRNANSNNFRIAEIAVYNDTAIKEADYTGIATADNAAYDIPAIEIPGAGGGNDGDGNGDGQGSGNQGGGQQGGQQGGNTLSDNYALTGTVTLSKENAGMGSAAAVNDGNAKYDGGTPYAVVVLDSNKGYVNIKLKEPKTVNYVKLVQSPQMQAARPMDFTVDVKFKDGTFKRVAEMHNVPIDKNTLEFKFAPEANVYAVRVSTNQSRNTSQKAQEFKGWPLTEIEIYNDSAITSADYTGATADANAAYNVPAYAKEAADLSDLVNYAKDAKVTVNKGNINYPVDRVTDGKKSYKDEICTTVYEKNEGYYELAFDKLTEVNQVIFYYTNQESDKRPIDYAVDVLLPTGKWKRVAAVYNSPNPSDWGSYYREFNFEPTKCFRVRVTGSNLRTKRGSNFHTTEIEIWNNPTVAATAYTGVQKADKAEYEISVPGDVDVSTLPATGDNSFPLMTAMIAVFSLAVLGIAAVVVFRKKLFN